MPSGRVIVTGAGGFIGSALCAAFAAQGRPYEGWVRDARQAIAPSLRVVGDLDALRSDALDEGLAGATAIVHAAGRAHGDPRSAGAASAMARDNTLLTHALGTAARRAGLRLVYLSSVKVNGDASAPGRPFARDDMPAPGDPYAHSKHQAEQRLLELADPAHWTPTILRLPMVYGAGARGNFRALVDAVRAGRRLPLAAIDNRRRLLSLPNLVGAVQSTLDASSPVAGVHFAGDADAVSTPQLVRAIAAALGVEPRLAYVPVPLLRLAGALTGRAAQVARLTQSLDFDTRSLTEATQWRPLPFHLAAQDVGNGTSRPGRGR